MFMMCHVGEKSLLFHADIFIKIRIYMTFYVIYIFDLL